MQQPTNLIYSEGTQVVALKAILTSRGSVAHPQGAVGVIVRAPRERTRPYRVRFVDGFESNVQHDNLVQLSSYKQQQIGEPDSLGISTNGLYGRVIFRCVIGSRAYGLEHAQSDTDRRGVYLPPADLHWSLYGVPGQLENDETQEAYWELQKFLILALKGNPNILECLYSPMVEHTTPLGQELLDLRSAFLSRLVYQTYNGYALSQFKKIKADLRNQGRVKWKHVMHLLRLLISGTHLLREGVVAVEVTRQRERLLEIRDGNMPWADVEAWRIDLSEDFKRAYEQTDLPERPDYEQVNAYLLRARRLALNEDLP